MAAAIHGLPPSPPHPELTHVRPDGCIPAPLETGWSGDGLQQGPGRRGRRGTAGHPMVPRPGNSRPERQNAHVRRPRLPWRPAMDAVSMSRDRIGRPRTATKPGGEGTRPKRAQQTAPERPERSALRRWQCGVALLLQSFPVPNWSRAATVSSAAGRRRHRWRPRRRQRRRAENRRVEVGGGCRRRRTAGSVSISDMAIGPSRLPRHCKRQTSHTGLVSEAWTSHRAIEHRAFTISRQIPLGADPPPPNSMQLG